MRFGGGKSEPRRRVVAGLWLLLLLTTGTPRAAGPLWASDRLTPYRFGVAGIQVPVSLPTGTVMAAMSIPAIRHQEEAGSFWVAGRRSGRTVMLATNLAGVGVRMVLAGNADAVGPQRGGGWDLWWTPPPLRPEVTVELVKTGPMQPGILRLVIPDVQYRLSSGPASRVQAVQIERLHYAGHLSVTLTGGGHEEQGQRLTRRLHLAVIRHRNPVRTHVYLIDERAVDAGA